MAGLSILPSEIVQMCKREEGRPLGAAHEMPATQRTPSWPAPQPRTGGRRRHNRSAAARSPPLGISRYSHLGGRCA